MITPDEIRGSPAYTELQRLREEMGKIPPGGVLVENLRKAIMAPVELPGEVKRIVLTPDEPTQDVDNTKQFKKFSYRP